MQGTKAFVPFQPFFWAPINNNMECMYIADALQRHPDWPGTLSVLTQHIPALGKVFPANPSAVSQSTLPSFLLLTSAPPQGNKASGGKWKFAGEGFYLTYFVAATEQHRQAILSGSVHAEIPFNVHTLTKWSSRPDLATRFAEHMGVHVPSKEETWDETYNSAVKLGSEPFYFAYTYVVHPENCGEAELHALLVLMR